LAQATTGLDAPTDPSGYVVNFSNTTAEFNSPGTPMEVDFGLGLQNKFFGCTNQIVVGSEGPLQELYVSFIQPMTSVGLVRALRLHLSIPHDTSGSTLMPGYTFGVGDPTNPTNCAEVFAGSLIVSDPTAADNSNCWAYQITSGTVQILNGLNFVGLAALRLTNVVATAQAAGAGNNAAYGGSGRVQMDGVLPILFEPLTTVIDPV